MHLACLPFRSNWNASVVRSGGVTVNYLSVALSGRQVHVKAGTKVTFLWNVQEMSGHHRAQNEFPAKLLILSIPSSLRQGSNTGSLAICHKTEDYTAHAWFLSRQNDKNEADAFAMVTHNNKLFWVITLCGLVEIYRYFWESYCLRRLGTCSKVGSYLVKFGVLYPYENICNMEQRINYFRTSLKVFHVTQFHHVLNSIIRHIRWKQEETFKGKRSEVNWWWDLAGIGRANWVGKLPKLFTHWQLNYQLRIFTNKTYNMNSVQQYTIHTSPPETPRAWWAAKRAENQNPLWVLSGWILFFWQKADLAVTSLIITGAPDNEFRGGGGGRGLRWRPVIYASDSVFENFRA